MTHISEMSRTRERKWEWEREREISNKRLMGKNIDWLSEAKNYTLLGRFVCVCDKEKKIEKMFDNKERKEMAR
jgi:hypothetical protein